ncbi:MAG: hypothetical protein KIT22_15160 [Verrucomicrobiae bacterium]|nr:hypothetical protein [Verrucomicrobiae bacterium]
MKRPSRGGLLRILWLILAAGAQIHGASAGILQEHSISFDLGPGETITGLQFPSYPASGAGAALKAVEIELEARWTLDLQLERLSGTGAGLVSFLISNSVVVLDSSEPEVPFSVEVPLVLSGEIPMDPGATVEAPWKTSGRRRVSLVMPSLVAQFQGGETPAFSLEFLARHPERVSDVPALVSSRFCGSRIAGRAVVAYRDDAPLAGARDDRIGAVLGPEMIFELDRLLANDDLGGSVLASGVEVDPRTAGGFPVELAGSLVLCHASREFSGADSFSYSVRLPDGGRSNARVFFEVVARPESAGIVPSVRELSGNLLVEAPWEGSAWVAVERSEGGISGPWLPMGIYPAGPEGQVALLDTLPLDSGARFYRLRTR